MVSKCLERTRACSASAGTVATFKCVVISERVILLTLLFVRSINSSVSNDLFYFYAKWRCRHELLKIIVIISPRIQYMCSLYNYILHIFIQPCIDIFFLDCITSWLVMKWVITVFLSNKTPRVSNNYLEPALG